MEALMSDLFLLSERQLARISPDFPLGHGVPGVDDRRVVSGIVYVIRSRLQWKDAPKEYGLRKTFCGRTPAPHEPGRAPKPVLPERPIGELRKVIAAARFGSQSRGRFACVRAGSRSS